eukprot:gnl/TRDRNA2_/TRDRNA2_133032_c0_seq2.p1 gnl/TRDRNA2_/TRDRNA2_133032_c0~~gnl/TRDRNA2_/TRDRNA2_133032_c0_seq2.p1  ORF type:complete len:473 (-),score=78.08 gnl/TRDRNA2_/TRDRNA2_133032_c0_seq2:156-1574(-)
MQWITTYYWTLDIFRSFFLGYLDGGFVELRPWAIWKTYLKTWFTPEFVIVALDWIFIFLGQGGGALRTGKSLRVLRIVRSIRLLRLVKMVILLRVLLEKIQSQNLLIITKVVSLVLLVAVVNHFFACTWFHITVGDDWDQGGMNWVLKNELEGEDFMHLYLISYHWSLAQFGLASSSIQPVNVIEYLIAIGALFMGVIICSLLVSIITGLMTQWQQINRDMLTQSNHLQKFMVENGISTDLMDCVTQWFRQKYEEYKRRVHEKDLTFLGDLPAALRMTLRKELYLPTLTLHPLFYVHKEDRILVMTCYIAMTQRHCTVHEHVFGFQEQATHMVFVKTGECLYIARTPDNEEKSRHKVGCKSWASEAAIWYPGWRHSGDFVSVTSVELMEMDGSLFRAALERFDKDDDSHPFRRYGMTFCRLCDEEDNEPDSRDDVSEDWECKSAEGQAGPEPHIGDLCQDPDRKGSAVRCST